MSGTLEMVPLPLRLIPKVDESLVGFIVRLAERNRFESPLWVARNVGIPFVSLEIATYTRFDLTPLSAASDVPVESLARMTCWPAEGDRRHHFLGHVIRREFLAVRQRRFCPCCLADAPYHRMAWDLAPLTVCPIHSVRLVTRCPSCAHRLRWNFGTITRCRCCCDLRTAPAEEVAQAELHGAAHAHRVLGLPGASNDGWRVLAPLDSLGADATLSLLFHLGWAATGRRLRPRPSKLAAVRNDMHRWLNVGFDACRSWPVSFDRYLDRLRQQAAERPGRYGTEKQFGWLVEWAKDPRESEAVRSLVFEAVERHVAGSAMAGRRATSPRGVGDRTQVPLLVAVQVLGRPRTRVCRVLSQYGLLTDGGVENGDGAAVDAAMLEAIKRELDDLVAREGLSRMLGCSDRVAAMILGLGFVEQAHGPAAELFGRVAWRRSDLRAFVKLLEHRARRCQNPESAIPLPNAVWHHVSRRTGCRFAPKRLLCGRAARLAVDARATGLSRILVEGESQDGAMICDVTNRDRAPRESFRRPSNLARGREEDRIP